MRHRSSRISRRVEHVKTTPTFTPDARHRAIQDIIDAGLITQITAADIIAHHDKINRTKSPVPGSICGKAKSPVAELAKAVAGETPAKHPILLQMPLPAHGFTAIDKSLRI